MLVQIEWDLLQPWQQERVRRQRQEQEAAFRERWKVDYWYPGSSLYEHYMGKKK